jgi:hypothetical protein
MLFKQTYLFCELDLVFEIDDAFLLDAGIVKGIKENVFIQSK